MNEETSTATTGTAETLLRVARAEFAAHGYEGASVRAITAAAGANLGAITYHYGSKRGLYEAVADDALGGLAMRVEAAARTEARAPLDRAGDVVRAFFEYFAAAPEVARLMVQALASQGGPPAGAAQHLQRMLRALGQLVVAGQRDGSMRAGDPQLMALTIVSNPLHLNIVRAPLLRFMNVDLGDEAVRERVILNAMEFVRGGLASSRERDPS